MARAGTTYAGVRSFKGPRPSPAPHRPANEPSQFGARITKALITTKNTAHPTDTNTISARSHTATHSSGNTDHDDATQITPEEQLDNEPTWFVAGKSGKDSFADAARAPTPARATPPIISVSQAKGQLTREQLYAMTKTQVVTAYGIRFRNPSRARAATKEAIVDAYMVKAASAPSTAPAARPPTQIFEAFKCIDAKNLRTTRR
jgi:hypothetical protein